MVDRRSSAENESNNYIANDEQTVSQKVDHDDVSNTETISQTSPPIVDLEIHDIEGIGPTTTKKLKEAGIVSVMDLAVASAEELAIDINISKESAATFVIGAQKLLRDSKVIESPEPKLITTYVRLRKINNKYYNIPFIDRYSYPIK